MLVVDFHTHSIQSMHAINTLEELLNCAWKKNIQAMAITDHSPGIDNTLHYLQNADKFPQDFRRIKGPDYHYFHVLLTRYQSPLEIPVQLFKGIECSILSHSERSTDLPLKLAPLLDIVIGSVHTLPHLFQFQNREQVTEKMIAAMVEPIDIIGHPCQEKSCPNLEPVVKKAAESGIAMELNYCSLHLKKANIKDTTEMLKLAVKYDCSISLGSDAHMSNELGRDDESKVLLNELNFPPELIVNVSLESARTFVASRKKIRQDNLTN
ncbi:MAG: hypothetical protein HOC24_04230 [Deltaproteobacteria bacterium]|jgi:putative hydrolase|nr:hypothetical protein [Deltaproteobacteria bacterium]